MLNSYKKFWTNLFVINGTASRADYWWPAVINFVIAGIFGGIFGNIYQSANGHSITEIFTWTDLGSNMIYNVIVLLLFLAELTVTIRRLHDSDHSGWWVLLPIIPVLGYFALLIMMLFPGRSNRWS
ncbi:DUF805 domain-containing protein [Eupransor demetentiae]|uniref:DUF805 family (YhaH) n=1 Tax=Eupransor demetentiae TaxID=3109584 RepID=A0ABP0EPL6_9LACO|nr:DUF805 family (yhaH) [Lactobacillaceae bacterium LMG 33000]